MYKTKSRTALELRKFMFFLLICHVVTCGVYLTVYDDMATDCIWEIANAYINYFSLMTLQSALVFLYCVIIEVRFVYGCLDIFAIMKMDSWLAPIAYFSILFFHAYGGYICFLRLKAYRYRDTKTDELTDEELSAQKTALNLKDSKEKKSKKKKKKVKRDDEDDENTPGNATVPSA